MTRTQLLCGPFLILTAALIGCSSSKLAPARVSGSISYNGQPIKAGRMQFHSPDGVGYDAQISPDGTYSATDIPEGELVVTVETEYLKDSGNAGKGKEADMRAKMVQPPPPGVASAPAPSAQYIKIPAKYAKPNTSPLTIKVSGGRNVQNIELAD